MEVVLYFNKFGTKTFKFVYNSWKETNFTKYRIQSPKNSSLQKYRCTNDYYSRLKNFLLVREKNNFNP